MEIFKLFGSIFVNTDKADESMKKTENNAGKIASALGNGVKTAAAWGTAIVGGATAAAGAVVSFATKSAEAADEVDKMSQKIGLSKEGYQEWAYIMGQNGMEIDKMQTGMKTLVAQMDSASSGTASAIENFEKLGVSIYDSNGNLKDQESMMNEVMVALADMENGTEKARLATELFGKSGVEMMPMLNQGSQAMTDLKDRAHDLGLVMSDEAVNSGVVFGDLMADIKQSVSMLGTNLGTVLFPILIQVCEQIISYMPMIQGLVSQIAPIVTSFMSQLLPALMELAGTLLPVIMDIMGQLLPFISEIAVAILPIIVQVIQALLPPLLQVVKMVLPVVLELLTALMPIFSALMPLLEPLTQLLVTILEPLLQIINMALPPLISMLTTLMQDIVPILSAVIMTLSDVIGKSLNKALNVVTGIMDNVIGAFQGVIDFVSGVFAGNWDKAFKGIVNSIKNTFGGIVNFIKQPINEVIGLLNTFISGINQLQVPDWVPGFGGKGINIPLIPMLAKGGNIVGAGRVLVGEEGPEILELPQGARVTPLSGTTNTMELDQLLNYYFTLLIEAIKALKESGVVTLDDPYRMLKLLKEEDAKLRKAGKEGEFA